MKAAQRIAATPFNINEYVRVRLSSEGLAILMDRHSDLARRWPSVGDFVPPKVDSDGWSEFQLWNLMQIFGPHITMGCKPPFETTIEFRPSIVEPTTPAPPTLWARVRAWISNALQSKGQAA